MAEALSSGAAASAHRPGIGVRVGDAAPVAPVIVDAQGSLVTLAAATAGTCGLRPRLDRVHAP